MMIAPPSIDIVPSPWTATPFPTVAAGAPSASRGQPSRVDCVDDPDDDEDDLAHLEVDPDLDSLREHPEFRELLGHE